jgi:regulator of protease activity HflC (stomatin/prohibitin superfamily)
MPNNQSSSVTQEVRRHAVSGWLMLPVNIILLLVGIAVLTWGIMIAADTRKFSYLILAGPIIETIAIILLCGHFTLQPNEARVLILFGAYHGTVRDSGFFWANPFYSRIRARIPLSAAESSRDASHAVRSAVLHTATGYRTLSAKISLRVRNFNSEKLKVNDKRGNPVEIASVVVWRVEDTARAAFDVDDFKTYVEIQSEAAIRHIASLYSYDRSEDDEPTLRDSADEVAQALQRELRERLQKAGLAVDEARLTHLAYAPEIAQAMLRRQQAEAIIAARKKIVHGAVSMVDMALRELSEKAVVEMDEERKAAMVSNLLVVLCGDKEISPVVNTGTLYT